MAGCLFLGLTLTRFSGECAGLPPIADTANRPAQSVPSGNQEYVVLPGEDLSAKIRQNIFVRVEVSKRQCYANEPILAVYKLYSRLHSESIVNKSPLLAGFSVYEMSSVSVDTPTLEALGGKMFSVRILLKKQLIPLRSGNIELDPMEVQNTLHFIRGTGTGSAKDKSLGGLLDQLSGEEKATPLTRSYLIRTDPVNIQVLAPPQDARPEHFSGLVGSFRISGSLSRSRILPGDTAVFVLQVQGTGYLPLLEAIPFGWPLGVDAFDPQVLESLEKDRFPLEGSKTFRYTISSKKPGITQIPPVTLSYFDPVLRTYQTVQTLPCSLEITDLAAAPARPAGSGSAGALVPAGSPTLWSKPFFWLPVAALLAAFCLYLIIRNRRLQQAAALARAALAPVEPIDPAPAPPPDPLADARIPLENKDFEGFYRELHRILWRHLEDWCAVPASTLNRQTIPDLLHQKGWSEESVRELQQLLQSCEMRLFLPGVPEQDVLADLALAEKLAGRMQEPGGAA